jgi:hypothetical protein
LDYVKIFDVTPDFGAGCFDWLILIIVVIFFLRKLLLRLRGNVYKGGADNW